MVNSVLCSPAPAVIDLLPHRVGEEICRLASGRLGGVNEIREIMIRCEGPSGILIGRESLRLYSCLCRSEMDGLVARLVDGALYAHRDSIASGYISIGRGVRVGICGYAAYEGGRLVGVSDMRSLLFRIPSGRCEFRDRLYSVFTEGIGRGMIIYSPPGVGKTTALRSLAASVGGGASRLRVCVVDERCELDEEDYRHCEVDILRGYKRSEGIEIATRTLSPDIIMIDEIGAGDSEALMGVVRCGIPMVATAHAADLSDLTARPSIAPLLELGAFSVAVGISCRNGEYTLTVNRL